MKNIRFFTVLAEQIVALFKNARASVLALAYITFLGSMLIANDMALLTFLPLGYFAVSVASAVLPFALAFAGGTMLYVISDEMIPETHAHGSENGATYSLLAGFCLMLVFDILLG